MRCDFLKRAFLSGVFSHSWRSLIDQIARLAIDFSVPSRGSCLIAPSFVKLPTGLMRDSILAHEPKTTI
jgi:hypothetical protein